MNLVKKDDLLLQVLTEITVALKKESRRYYMDACDAHESNDKKQMLACIHYSEALNWAETKVRLIAESHGVELNRKETNVSRNAADS